MTAAETTYQYNILNEKRKKNGYRLLFNWKDCLAENECEYYSRVRKTKLLATMKKIVTCELDKKEQTVLKLRYLEDLSLEEIASLVSMTGSSVYRCLKKAENTIGAYMKYVFQFAETGLAKADEPLDVKMALSLMFLEHSGADEIRMRMKKVRTEKFISLDKAALCTGVPKDRIIFLENTGGGSIYDLKRLMAFYGVSADYVFFGAE